MTFQSIVEIITRLVTNASYVIALLILLFFFWNGTRFIIFGGDAKWREQARPALVWGLVILLIMFTLWGVIRILRDTIFL